MFNSKNKMLEINESSYFSLVDIKTVVKRPFEIISHDVFTNKVDFKWPNLRFFPIIIWL